MKKSVLLAVAIILMLTTTALAYDVTKDDISAINVKVVINGKSYNPNEQNGVFYVSHYCYGGEKVEIVYDIQLSNPSALNSRNVVVHTQLANGNLVFLGAYIKGGGVYPTASDEQIPESGYSFTMGNPDSGYSNINITISGKIPTPNKRFVKLYAFSLNASGAAPDCFPPVVIPVVNKQLFKSDLNSAKNTYNQLNSELNKYLGQVDTSDLSKDLKLAKSNLSDAETLFNSGDYAKANEKLNAAENWLNKAKEDLKKVEAEYKCKELQDEANKIYNLINQISAYIDEINSGAVKMNISEKIQIKSQFNEIQSDYSSLQADIGAVKAAITNGLYDDAIARAKNAMDFASKTYIKAENLLNQLEKSVATPKKTAKSQPMPSISFNRTTLAIVVGVIVAAIVIAIILYMRGGGRFDELR